MARPKGSKNKKKTPTLNVEEFKVDWEVLAKRLQQALASEIKENDELKKEVESYQFVMRKAAARHAVLQSQIKMLENMLAEHIARGEDGNDPV